MNILNRPHPSLRQTLFLHYLLLVVIISLMGSEIVYFVFHGIDQSYEDSLTDIIQASDFAQARDQNALLKSLATAYVIEFADQGAGIPEDVRSAVFQPFIRPEPAAREPVWDCPSPGKSSIFIRENWSWIIRRKKSRFSESGSLSANSRQ